MIVKAKVSSIEGNRFRVIVNGRVSALLPRVSVLKNDSEKVEIVVGDTVLAVFYSETIADGAVIGKLVN